MVARASARTGARDGAGGPGGGGGGRSAQAEDKEALLRKQVRPRLPTPPRRRRRRRPSSAPPQPPPPPPPPLSPATASACSPARASRFAPPRHAPSPPACPPARCCRVVVRGEATRSRQHGAAAQLKDRPPQRRCGGRSAACGAVAGCRGRLRTLVRP